jgi:hypothetical protein
MPVPGDSYREKAEYCSKMARDAPTQDLRDKWLNLAAVWLSMAQNRMVLQDGHTPVSTAKGDSSLR